MKKMVWFAVFAVIGIVLLAIPVSANPCPPPVISEGSGILTGTGGADLDTGTLNLPFSQWSETDIWWEQPGGPARRMVPQNGATIVNLGVVNFDEITVNHLEQLPYSATPIPGNDDTTNQLINDDVFAVHTKSGNWAKVKVLNYGYSITLQWVTFNKDYCSFPEFPLPILPATMIIGFIGAVLFIQRTREH
ncbi:MAG: hypothetical protein EHM53_06860 [Methanoregulaceae archaeon]|nr:MAG: hypothetical protein EHM53_06860 [Methanoregulaceae archaeon]